MRGRSAAKRTSPLRLVLYVVILIPVVFIIYRLCEIGAAPIQSISTDKNLRSLDGTVEAEEHIIKKKIAYAITVTKDGPFVDGALVLGYAAKKIHQSSNGFQSKYDPELVAFVAPGVTTSRQILANYGWKILEREVPVKLDEIENKEYADNMKKSGCCGADEFLKLWAYTLTDYHRVVHLDMDSILFKNMVR